MTKRCGAVDDRWNCRESTRHGSECPSNGGFVHQWNYGKQKIFSKFFFDDFFILLFWPICYLDADS
jgi:hypothetical protein